MNTSNTAPEQFYGYKLNDATGSKIGDVDGVWVDDATSELEFIGVKTGFLMGKTHLMPARDAQISDGTIQVPYSKDQIHGAPSFGTDAELSPEDEDSIYSYYNLDRSTAPSPTGLAGGGADTADTGTGFQDTGTTGADYASTSRDAGTDNQDITLSEEELRVGKRQVQAGQVRIRKVVRTEHVTEPVELRREDVEIERVDARGASVGDNAFQEQTIEVPVMREEPVVATEAHVTGRVQVNKDVETETRTVEGDVRSEDVEVDRDVDSSGTGTRGGYRSDTGTDSVTTDMDSGRYTDADTTDRSTQGEGLADRVRDAANRNRDNRS